GLIVALAGHRWVEKLMPPVVTGAVVAVIGLNLAPIAVKGVSGQPFDTAMGLVTVVAVGLVAVVPSGLARRVPILLGGLIAYAIYLVLANGLGFGKPIDFAVLANSPWFGMPNFAAPVFDAKAVGLIAPVAIVLVAENL